MNAKVASKTGANASVQAPKAENLPATVPTNLPSTIGDDDDFSGLAGQGMENVTPSDLLIPRLAITQGLSPQLNRSKSEYIPGAEQGVIFDVGTGELFKDGVLFIPVYYRKDYLEWAPRQSGKGLVNIHSDASILEQCSTDNEHKQSILPNGNIVIETAQFYGLNLTVDSDGRMSFLPMASTQLKKGRKWLTLATGEKLKRADGSTFVPPLFYRSYFLTAAGESNARGEWFGWNIQRGPTLPELGGEDHGFDWRKIKQRCIEFRESLIKGEARGDVASMGGDGEGSNGDGERM
jgi:hypothetical protein